jgi:hypothetical protein
VRKLIGWTAGIVGIAALARLLAHRRRPHVTAPPAAAQPPVDDHAEALRRKLDATRAAEEREPAAAPEAEKSKESLEKRRARVHAKAQEAIEAMHEEPLA